MSELKTNADLTRSIKDRLKTAAKEDGRSMNHALAAYAIKGFLRRAAVSEHAGRWAVKGGNLMFVWTEDAGRPTFDLDLESLDQADMSVEEIANVYDDIAAIEMNDGLDLRMSSKKMLDMTGEGVVGHSLVGSVRMGDCVIKMKIDFGFGDTITPAPKLVDFPPLFRGDKVVSMLAYPIETAIAEKLHAMRRLGADNTRLKDYYDIFKLASTYDIDSEIMKRAVQATFDTRNARRRAGRELEITGDLDGLADKFVERWSRQWSAWIKHNNIDTDATLEEIIGRVREFAIPLLNSIQSGDELKNWSHEHQGWVLAAEPSMVPA